MSINRYLSLCKITPFIVDEYSLERGKIPAKVAIGSKDFADSLFAVLNERSCQHSFVKYEANLDSSSGTTTTTTSSSVRNGGGLHSLIQGQTVYFGVMLQSVSESAEYVEAFPHVIMKNIQNLVFNCRLEDKDGCIYREKAKILAGQPGAMKGIFASVSEHPESQIMIVTCISWKVPEKNLNSSLSLIASISVNEQMYNQVSAKNDDKMLRGLIEDYRFRPTKPDVWEASLSIEYRLPIFVSASLRELPMSHMSLCSVLVENRHPQLSLVLHSLNVQHNETKSIITRGSSVTSDHKSPSFLFEFVSSSDGEFSLPCTIKSKEAISFCIKIGAVNINEDSTIAAFINQYFGEYITPMIIWWKMAKECDLTPEVAKDDRNISSLSAFQSNIRWFLGSNLSVKTSQSRGKGKEVDPNPSISNLLISCEAPPAVEYLQPFVVKFILKNKGRDASVFKFHHDPEMYSATATNICPFCILDGIDQMTILPDQVVTRELSIMALNTSGCIYLNEITIRDIGRSESHHLSKQIPIYVGTI